MKLNFTKTQSLIVSGFKTSLPLHHDICVDGTVLSTSGSLKVLGVIYDRNLTFEKHIYTYYCFLYFPQKLGSCVHVSECLVMKLLSLNVLNLSSFLTRSTALQYGSQL